MVPSASEKLRGIGHLQARSLCQAGAAGALMQSLVSTAHRHVQPMLGRYRMPVCKGTAESRKRTQQHLQKSCASYEEPLALVAAWSRGTSERCRSQAGHLWRWMGVEWLSVGLGFRFRGFCCCYQKTRPVGVLQWFQICPLQPGSRCDPFPSSTFPPRSIHCTKQQHAIILWGLFLPNVPTQWDFSEH